MYLPFYSPFDKYRGESHADPQCAPDLLTPATQIVILPRIRKRIVNRINRTSHPDSWALTGRVGALRSWGAWIQTS